MPLGAGGVSLGEILVFLSPGDACFASHQLLPVAGWAANAEGFP
jgi:hypothetical protein